MAKTGVVLRGVGVVAANMRRRSSAVEAGVLKGVNDTAQDVFNDSQRLVPVDTGNLKGSARLNPAKSGKKPSARVSYGGTAAAYAVIVHEIHASRSKYLEEPFRKHMKTLRERLRKAVRKATR